MIPDKADGSEFANDGISIAPMSNEQKSTFGYGRRLSMIIRAI